MSLPFPAQLQKSIEARGVVAVLVLDEVSQAVPLARALIAGGITAMELTLRTPAALDCLRAIRDGVPEMLAGVGTVIDPRQVAAVVAAGAAFGVAPGVNRRVIEAAVAARLPFAPGIATASDIETALEWDCRLLKFFPAETSGGLRHLSSLAAPYAHLGLRYIPLGGLGPQNMRTYLESPLIAALGGSWIAPREMIAGSKWTEIETRARAASDMVRAVHETRPAP
jgi:2-dehydro-3-deoxyphosphogluconate aldolase/(4S)-4-hydroxy-2-oxoglutarate aldolase